MNKYLKITFGVSIAEAAVYLLFLLFNPLLLKSNVVISSMLELLLYGVFYSGFMMALKWLFRDDDHKDRTIYSTAYIWSLSIAIITVVFYLVIVSNLNNNSTTRHTIICSVASVIASVFFYLELKKRQYSKSIKYGYVFLWNLAILMVMTLCLNIVFPIVIKTSYSNSCDNIVAGIEKKQQPAYREWCDCGIYEFDRKIAARSIWSRWFAFDSLITSSKDFGDAIKTCLITYRGLELEKLNYIQEDAASDDEGTDAGATDKKL